MENRIDLHMHSTASDGTLTPEELVRFAYEDNGVTVMALTDHDTVSGLQKAADAARRFPIRFIPGIELSCNWAGSTIHVVGLGVNPRDDGLQAVIRKHSLLRTQRAVLMAQRFDALGIHDIYADAVGMARNKDNVSRSHFARALVARGDVPNVQVAFDKYLAAGAAAFIPSGWVALAEAIALLKHAGAVTVLAHPGRYRMKELWQIEALVKAFKTSGGEAMEVVSGSQGSSYTSHCLNWAIENHLYASSGSDFHSLSGSRPRPGAQGELPHNAPSVLTLLSQ